jgi:ATP adenylyltransferase
LKRKKLTAKKTKAKKLAQAEGSLASHLHLMQKIWPQERDFFERPDRYRYVRKLVSNDACVFCEAAKADLNAESLVLYRDRNIMVVMNKYPYNTGHLLLMPTQHIGNIWDLTDEVTAQLALWLKRSAQILSETLKCQGFNAGLNHGAVAGAGIPAHLHWHLVPRWSGDTNFFPLIAETKVLPETLEQTYNRLRPLFDKGKST